MHNHKDVENIKTRQFTFSRVNRDARSVQNERICHHYLYLLIHKNKIKIPQLHFDRKIITLHFENNVRHSNNLEVTIQNSVESKEKLFTFWE